MNKRTALRSVIATAALSLALAACGGSTLPTNVPSIAIPTLPPDMSSAAAAGCVDAPTLAIINQLRAAGADAPSLLEANKDALISGLGRLQSDDPALTTWRDSLVAALESDDMDAAAAEIGMLASDEVTITPC